jgi:hypothetical protein
MHFTEKRFCLNYPNQVGNVVVVDLITIASITIVGPCYSLGQILVELLLGSSCTRIIVTELAGAELEIPVFITSGSFARA